MLTIEDYNKVEKSHKCEDGIFISNKEFEDSIDDEIRWLISKCGIW